MTILFSVCSFQLCVWKRCQSDFQMIFSKMQNKHSSSFFKIQLWWIITLMFDLPIKSWGFYRCFGDVLTHFLDEKNVFFDIHLVAHHNPVQRCPILTPPPTKYYAHSFCLVEKFRWQLRLENNTKARGFVIEMKNLRKDN